MKRIIIIVFTLLIVFSCKTVFAGQFKFPGKKVKTNKTVYIDMNSDGVKDSIRLVKNKKGYPYSKYSVYVNIQYGIRKIYGNYTSLCVDLGCNFRARKRTPDVIQQKKTLLY